MTQLRPQLTGHRAPDDRARSRGAGACVIGVPAVAACLVLACGSFDGYYPRGAEDQPAEPPPSSDAVGKIENGVEGSLGTEERRLVAAGFERHFVLARAEGLPGEPLPLVISFHGNSDTLENSSEAIRAALPIEAAADGAAVFAYPRTMDVGGSWLFFSDAGRRAEAAFVQALISALHAELGIDDQRVFLVGWDGGATLVNALACRLGKGVVRGVAAQSGSLYPLDNESGQGQDFDADGSTGETSCALPSALLIWGKADAADALSYLGDGATTRMRFWATQHCSSVAEPWGDAVCVTYPDCREAFVWCPIDGLDHHLWAGAAPAIWHFFDGLR